MAGTQFARLLAAQCGEAARDLPTAHWDPWRIVPVTLLTANMPIDREVALRAAQTHLQQGKLDLAIAEYQHVLLDDPDDHDIAMLLGELYVRAGHVDLAVRQLSKVADALLRKGVLSKCAELSRRILTLRPDDERGLIQAGEIASAQGQTTAAHGYFLAAADWRATRGDLSGAADLRARVDWLDLAPVEARLTIARTRQQTGSTNEGFSDAAPQRADGARPPGAGAAKEGRGSTFASASGDARGRSFHLYVRSGDLDEARRHASTPDDWQVLAGALGAAARHDEAIEALSEAARLDPADTRVAASLARTFVARGDAVRAAEYLTAEMAGDDPVLLLAVSEIQLRAGRTDEAVALARLVISDEPSLADEVARLGLEAAPHAADPGFRLVSMAADVWADQAQWRVAAATLEEFVQIVPNHVPALVRLVEIGVDGGLPSVASHGQAKLADTYLANGAGLEALVAAEDLAQREPWNPEHIERLRQALRLTGESNPDAVIAQWLSPEFARRTTTPERAEATAPREPVPQANSSATGPTVISFPQGAAPARRARK